MVGGPIVPDRVWFFATHTSQKADTVAGGIFHETFVPGTTATRIMARWFSGATERNSPKHTHMARTSVSCVTGSHNMKFGMTGLWLGENAINSNHNDWRYGWGNRQANWEITASIQQQLVDGLSLDVGYFRRSWINFFVEDDRNLGAGDFDVWTAAVPQGLRDMNPDIPATVDLYNLKAGSVQVPDTLFTAADNFGEQTHNWQGFDVTIDGRLQNLLIQGGLSTGATSTNNRDLSRAAPEFQYNERAPTAAITPQSYCEANHGWLTQAKFLGL